MPNSGDNVERPEGSKLKTFEEELTVLINKYNIEALSATPDFILAFFVKDCLIAWQNAQTRRTEWYKRETERSMLKGSRESQFGSLD